MKELYEFGRFTLDVAESRPLRDGQPLPLKPKVLETLSDKAGECTALTMASCRAS